MDVVEEESNDDDVERGANAAEALLTSSQKKVQIELARSGLAGTPVGPYVRRALLKDTRCDVTYGPRVVGDSYFLGSKNINLWN
ncbi:hypothetical protein LSTR_LSTR014874 [Laodelphax striatellus]|uniref:Uncharacterized protein n=1 Tax=Laodelphax striatellus TaxID=195883 RepID=A0A482WKM7_LAOST|nr:hypothetical protein LSTR_LSTR014874 [Laodelphax striatellus]